MAQDDFSDWSQTSSNNISITGDAAPINIDEGMAPGSVNDAMRAIMSAAARFDSFGGSNSDAIWFDTNALAAAATIDAAIDSIRTQGYTTLGDRGGGVYKRVGSEPTHSLKIQSADLAWWELVPAGGVVNPKQAGAAGDAATDDLIPLQAIWDFASANGAVCDMLGLSYNCSDSLLTSSNLTVIGNWCTLFITAWPSSGGFITNVTGDPLTSVQSNVRLEQLIVDGQKLATPTGSENNNLIDFARGMSNLRVIDCVALHQRDDDGTSGGTGGGGFGVELGGHDIQFVRCRAEDCYRGIRVAGIPGAWADAAAELKQAVNVTITGFTAKRCGTAILCHTIGDTVNDGTSDLAVMDALFDGVYVEDCGHYPHRAFDFTTYPSIPAQKTGVIVLGGAQNVIIRNVRVKLNTTYPASFTDYWGRSGYPASGDFIGAGLSGNVGALVWGHGMNCAVESITLDGTVDNFWRCNRAVTFGEISTTPPTDGTGAVKQFALRDVQHVRGTAPLFAFDGQTGLNNANMSCRMEVTRFAVFVTGVVGTNGTATLTNLDIRLRDNAGREMRANAVDWLAFGNAAPGGTSDFWHIGDVDFGGGYSATGARLGTSYDSAANIWRTSVDAATAEVHYAFYNTNGLVGSIATSGSATVYATSSDKRLKDDLRDFDGLGMIAAMKVYDFDWKQGGRGIGVIAQEIAEIMPEIVTEGDSVEMWNGKAYDERIPWAVDYSKLVPVLLRAIQQLDDRLKAAGI